MPRRITIALVLVLLVALPATAQELDPRRWSHVPMGINIAGAGYAYTDAKIAVDPVLQIENMELEMHTTVAKYIRTFELFDKSARVDLTQAYRDGQWSGLLQGAPASTKRGGLSDTVVRFAVNLIGAPPLEGKEYEAYRAKKDVETIVGVGLAVQLPTGEYEDDKLINLGTNRYTFRPQLGMVHTRGKWSIELTGSVWIYTDNDEFFNGNKLENDPLYILHGHLIHTFRPGFWMGASAGYDFGGKSTLNGEEKDDRKGNLSWALSLGFPITPKLGVKVAYIQTRTQEPVGKDTDTLIVAFSTFW